MSKRMYPAIAGYPGAKSGYVGQVIAEILPYDGIQKYYDVFGGMANIILHKAPHPEEYYNDLNKKLATLMLVLSDEELSKELFRRMLNSIEYYSKSGFDYAQFQSNFMLDPDGEFMQKYAYNHTIDTVEKAAAVWRTLLLSFDGNMQNYRKMKKGTELLELEDQLLKKVDIPERLKNVNILNEDAFELIELVKPDEHALMVCDSPYVKKVMSTKKGVYEKEITDQQQEAYVQLLYDSKAKALVCGYDNDIYDSVLLAPNGTHQWYKYIVAEVAKSMSVKKFGESKPREKEIIWTNWKVY